MPTPLKLEDGGQVIVNDLLKVNLGTDEDRPTFISACLSAEEYSQYITFFKENRDVFAWN